jgi:amidase
MVNKTNKAKYTQRAKGRHSVLGGDLASIAEGEDVCDTGSQGGMIAADLWRRVTMRLRIVAAKFATVGFAALGFAVAVNAQDSARVVKYEPTYATVKFAFGPGEPVARLAAGEVLETDTLNCTADCAGIPPDKLEFAKNSNLLTGPFYIEGAAPGDTLAIEFLEMHPNGDGTGDIGPGFGAINSSSYTPMLNPALPRHSWAYPIHREDGTATFTAHDSNFSVKIPMHPFLGCVGVAPALGETRDSLVPAEFGGNMDSSESSVGNTLYLPVNVAGALVYVGDGHAAMGDGEIGGTAIEVPMHVRLRFHVIRGQKIEWPRWESSSELMAAGIYRPLDDCLRIAFTQLVGWIHSDYGLSEMDAYELLSKTATIHLAEMVDPNYVVIAKIDKKFLPPKKN